MGRAELRAELGTLVWKKEVLAKTVLSEPQVVFLHGFCQVLLGWKLLKVLWQLALGLCLVTQMETEDRSAVKCT